MRALVIFVVFGSALAVPRSMPRIVGGSNATIEEFPYMTNLLYSSAGTNWIQFCGGSLITSLSVLTAAHCVERTTPHQWRANLGSSYRNTGGTPHVVARFIEHPEYQVEAPMDANVAIVRLLLGATLSPTIQTVSIASAASVLYGGLPVTTIGWGFDEYEGVHSEQLQKADVNIIDQQICIDRYTYLQSHPEITFLFTNITSRMACAGLLDVGGKGGCDGDDGGPVVFRGDSDIVVGITSFSYGCAEPTYPAVITRVPSHTAWIVENA